MIVAAVFGVLYSLGIPAGFLWALRGFHVPEMARRKQLNQAVAELVQLYQKRHGHDLDGLCSILQLRKGDAEQASRRAGSLKERTAVLHRHVQDVAENGQVELASVSAYLQSCRVELKGELLARTVAEHCAHDGGLDCEGLRRVFVGLVAEHSAFSGEESFEELSDEQMARLLQQRWHAQAKDEEQEEEELVSFRQSVGAEQSVRGAWSRTMSWSGHGGEVEGLGREELQWKLEELIEHLWALQVLGHSGGWWDGALGQQEEEAKSYVGFLFRGYRISHYWWEVMVRPPALPPPSLAPACHCFGAANRLPAVPATASRSRDPKPYPSANPNLLLGPEPGTLNAKA